MKIVAALAVVVLVGVGFLLYELHSAHGTLDAAHAAAPQEPVNSPTNTSPSPSPSTSPTRVPDAPTNTPPPPSPSPSHGMGAATPHVPAMVTHAATRFADPRFAGDPERRVGVTVPEAVEVALHGETTIERNNAIWWLMNNGGPEQYSLFKSLTQDRDPVVRGTAHAAVSVMRSRFPTVER